MRGFWWFPYWQVPFITISRRGKPDDGEICKGCCRLKENNTRQSKDNNTDWRYWLHYWEGERKNKQRRLFKSNSLLKEQDRKKNVLVGNSSCFLIGLAKLSLEGRLSQQIHCCDPRLKSGKKLKTVFLLKSMKNSMKEKDEWRCNTVRQGIDVIPSK